MKVLVVDVGGTNVKMLATGETEPIRFPSGPSMTVERMVASVKELDVGWKYDVISLGYPGVVAHGKVAIEPYNLPPGWVGFNYEQAFGVPVRVMNDAAMQALGSYQGGELLFLGLGTGLGSALVYNGAVIPMEVGHLSYKDSTYEDYLGARGLQRLGATEWTRYVTYCVERLVAAFHPDDVVLGGGNAKRLESLPPKCRLGNNAMAFVGGFRLWEK